MMFGSKFQPRLDVSESDVAAYFRKNDDVNLSVPLAIVRQVREEIVHKLGHDTGMTRDDLSCAQGMLRGLARFEHVYLTAVARRDKYVLASGKVE